MLNKFRSSLKNKVVLVNILLVIIFAVCLVFLLNRLVVNTLISTKRETVRAVVEGEVRKLQFALSRPSGAVNELSKDEKIVSYFTDKNKIKDTEVLEIFKSLSLGREYSNVYLMDTSGEVVVSTDPSFLNNNFSFRDYYKEALSGRSHIQIAFGVLTHKPGYYFSAPVMNNGVVSGVAVIKTDVSYINNILSNSPIESLGHYFLSDENGVIVSTDKEIEEYQSFGIIPNEKRARLVEERRFEGFGMKPLQYQILQDEIDHYKGPASLDYEDKEDKEEELLQIYKIGDYPFYLATESDLESIFAQVNNMLWPIIVLMGGAVTVGILIQFLIFGKMFKPLLMLEKYTRGVADGKIDEQFEIKSNDELQSLSDSVSKMVSSLGEAKLGLEVRVREKTEELSKKISELDAKNTQMGASETAMLNVLEDSRELETQLAEEKKSVEQKVVERTKQLADEQAKLMASITALPRAIVIVDPLGKIVVQNGKLEKILGVNSGEWSIEKIDEKLGDSFGLKQKMNQVIMEKKIFAIDEFVFGKKYLKVYMAPVISKLDEIIGAVIMIEDATEEKVLARSKDEFFSIASHELRTPLTAIRGNTSMMLDYYKDTFKDPDLKQMMDDTHEASVRLIGIVNDFLDMSRLEMGKVQYKIEEVKLLEIVEKVVKDLDENAKTKGVELKTVGDSSVLAKADSGKVEQILFNMIGNSLKFTDKGYVKISVSSYKNQARIEIADTGKGIPVANQGLLFHKFQQAGSSLMTREGARGTGLGLYISRLIAEGMGGRLELIKTEEGKGSTFGVILPLVETKK